MKFSQMPYERPDLEGMKQTLSGLVERLKGAASYEEAEEIFYGEMELNPEEPDVSDFMNIIKEYFGR